MEKIVLAYTGGLETSVALAWLAEKHRAEIVTLTLDLGQGRELDDVRERALAIGAARAHVLDVREEFARAFVQPALQAGAIREGRAPLTRALSRPLIAKRLIEIAHIEGASAIAHASATKTRSRRRIDLAAKAIDADIAVIAPAQNWGLSRVEQIEFAQQRGIPVPVGIERSYAIDANLWGRSVDCGVLDDAWREPPEELFLLTKSAAEAPDRPAYVDIEFERGVPIKVNDVAMPLMELIQSLETIAGAHGIGRVDLVEQRRGVTSREVCEAPAGVALHLAHRELQSFVTPRDLDRLTVSLGARYADLIEGGQWYSATRDAIDALVTNVQEKVSGVVRMKFFKGDCRVVGRQSPHALQDAKTGSGGRALSAEEPVGS